MRNRSVLTVLVLSLLLGLSPLAADPVIERGTDAFTTVADGKTFYDFSYNPIPAGFFCKGSKAFTGRVAFKGLPLATEIPGQLRGADTVIERLDNAAFDDKGIAVTRLQFRALSLASIAPIKTSCGAFHVYVSLDGQQRVTTMNILRTQEGGGNFVAPLAVDTRMTFIPVKPARNKRAQKLELKGSITFPASPIPWSFREGAMEKRIKPVVVDTNGDQAPDTLLSGTSNFSPGRSSGLMTNKGWDFGCPSCAQWTCHAAEGHEHCYIEPVPSGCFDVAICIEPTW
ncbi:MAG TPA: hypothetical protein VLE27_07440 [Thermoanaerobaculia bacterium]|nr:hypothetical protein [Thermoanaerobaculia bacterium]